MRLLVIDDDASTIDAIKDSIVWESFDIDMVESLTDFESAKHYIVMHSPDIIICETELPNGSGINLIKWIRDNCYHCQVIFLTCYKKFEFASKAIEYDATSYITKPLNILQLKAEIAKSIDNIHNNIRLAESSHGNNYWIEYRNLSEESFWKDLLFCFFPSRSDIIQTEIKNRQLPIDMKEYYYLVLTTVDKSQLNESEWDEITTKYALRNITSEVILDSLNSIRDFSTFRYGKFYNNIIVRSMNISDIESKCYNLIKVCKKLLNITMTCYISAKTNIENLVSARTTLELMDKNNIMFKGQVILENGASTINNEKPYSLNNDLFKTLLKGGHKTKITENLREELNNLVNENRLDYYILHSIHHDFIQIIYSTLHDNNIQAHKLFGSDIYHKLTQDCENSIADMMSWAAYITNITIDYIREVHQSESIIEKVKRLIQENYANNISREEISSSVFLTPDYLSKIFLAKTGQHITDYINECKIEKAKELLIAESIPISEVALKTGFENLSYFSTVFKKATGKSPSDFKKENI